MPEWTIDRGRHLRRGTFSIALAPADIAHLAEIEAIDELERQLAVHSGAPQLRNNLGNEPTAHDVALYGLQEVLRGWRRWSVEADPFEDGAAQLTDGVYALRLTTVEVSEIADADPIANVQTALDRVATHGRHGREDLAAAFGRDNRGITAQLREIREVVKSWRDNPHDGDDNE